MNTVFITDGLLRKSLSTTRSLGKRGIETIVGEKSGFSPSGFSRYCHKRVKYPNPQSQPHLFMGWLVHLLQQENQPVFLPMDDAVLDVVMNYREEITKASKCLLPSKSSYEVAADKYETMQLARQQKIDSPITYLVKDFEDLSMIGEAAAFPLIMKPRKSSGSRGIRKVQNKEELLPLFLETQQDYQEIIVQEFIPLGDRYDVCLLFDRHSEVKASFVQKELRHFPVAMGPSTVQESVIYDDLIERSIQLLKPLGWIGIVEVEFMMDSRTNQPKVLEINPRFWNSLDLAVQSGVDFPYLLVQLCLDKETSPPEKVEIGRRSRWFFPGDLLHFLWNPNRLAMDPPLVSGKKQRVYDDTFSLHDPLPGVIWILTCCRFLLDLRELKNFIKR